MAQDTLARALAIKAMSSGGGSGTTYTAGDNITIEGNVISATDTTYTAGTGIDITSGEISIDSDTINTINMASTDASQALSDASQAINDASAAQSTADSKSVVSGENDGTNWTSITINDDTYAIASLTAGTGIDITDGVISLSLTSAESEAF